jgi:TolB-like protein/Tfp pilus assembly protein PilF
VLPFINTNPDSADDYLGYGVAAELTRALGQLPRLRMADRASAFGGGDRDPVTLGRRLDVGSVLEGTVRRAGDRLRITAHLVDVEEGFDLWSETYDRGTADLLQIQAEIRGAIAGILHVSVGVDSAGRLGQPTSSPEAYDAYLAGLYRLSRPSPEAAQAAVASFSRAIRLDSSFALAYAGLAEAHTLGGSVQSLPPRLTVVAAETAALRALELDSTLAAPHRALGAIRFGYNRDWQAAEAELERAIALEPRSPAGYQAYSRFLLAMGRSGESLQAIQRAVEVSPAAPGVVEHLGWHYLHAREYGPARDALDRSIVMDSTDWRPHFDLSLLEQAAGNFDAARAHLQRAVELAPWPTELQVASGQINALSGHSDVAQSILQQLQETSASQYISPYLIACIEAALGQRSEAFASLGRAVKERSDLVPYLRIDPRLDSLRTDARFDRLVRQIRLP